jgi:L-amino acid N-acyltransferase YncA
MGLGKILMKKLAEAAKENGIDGLIAFTNHDNQGMIKLFQTLPYTVKKKFEENVLVLTCHFNELV